MRYTIGELTTIIKDCTTIKELINMKPFINDELEEEGIYSPFEKIVINNLINHKLETLNK
jgi:molybdopterin converting factor small subunit